MVSTRVRVAAGLVAALAVVAATYAGLAALRDDARAADDAANRLVVVRMDIIRLLDVPWGASPEETDDPDLVAEELLGGVQGVRSELEDIAGSSGLPEREEFLLHFDRSVAALDQILAAVSAGDDVGNAGTVSARQMYRADSVLEQAARRLRADADRSASQESQGSAVLVGCLFVAFALYFVRSVRSRAKLAGAAAELAESRDAAVVAAQEKSAFLATMSHEIRTPLNGLVGLNELLLRTSLDTYQEQLVKGAETSGRTLLRLINDVLDLSKIDAGRLVLESIDFDLRQLLDEIAVVLGIQAREKGVQFVVSCHPDVPDLLRGDPTRLGQVIYNLSSNALKFTSRGEVSVRALAYDHATRQAVLRVEVNDTGPGVPPCEREHIFEPYSQADASTTRKYGGTGLGLAIARQIVEAMGGAIGVEDGPQGGALFWFTVPLVPGEDATTSAAGPGPELGAGHRVLVVDDNEVNRLVAGGFLAAMGYEPVEAVDGVAALDAVRAAGPDAFAAVLMDVHMPRMDGYAAARALRELEGGRSRVPILALTATAAPSERETCLEAGMDDFLTKPLRREQLETALEHWVRA
ncbi:ATP-binding protein [Nocardioides aquiterrae]|uniref:histidine kinase n=1 Tax=Nocardioides aquiterrae TaxID=203799 RepID=A0ABP4F4Q0_9ACTN